MESFKSTTLPTLIMCVSKGLRHSLLCISLLALIPCTNAQFSDNFSDGDFTSAPVWTGNTSDFNVNASAELQLNAMAAGSAYLQSDFTMATLNQQEWRFRIAQSFSPSGSNFGRVYLASDQNDLSGNLNGYYLQFGEAGSNDAIELFEVSNGSSTSVARGADGFIAGSFNLGIRVTRDASGVWNILTDATGGTNYVFHATGVNTTHTTSAHLGVSCTYTISNATNFFFDDFYAGPMLVDMTAPTITAVEIIDADEITVVYDEAVEQSTAETASNYDIQPFLSASSAIQQGADPTRVDLTLLAPMTNGMGYNLIVTNVEDLAGNAITSAQFMYTYAVPDVADPRDVVINELMPDPNPVVALPDAEYIELYNASSIKNFDLSAWTIDDGTSTATLPTFTLLPDSFVVITDAANLGLFAAFSNVLGVSSFPSLNNTGDLISLRDDTGALIDEVNYSTTWYNDSDKDDGGWSLEQINPNTPCSGIDNWTASNNLSGGSPGVQNSVYDISPDVLAPSLIQVSVNTASSITLLFDEALDPTSIALGTYQLQPGLGVGAATTNGTASIDISLTSNMNVGQVYTITVSAITDCAGNSISSSNSGTFGLPEAPQVGDVVINELLFDPLTGGSDYVELYNKSNRIIDVAALSLANIDNGIIDNVTSLTSAGLVLLPSAYLLLTADGQYVAQTYPDAVTSNFLVTALPSYNNGEGSVVLLDNVLTTLDRFDYSEDLHFELLAETEGVSLERVNPNRDSEDNSNWHSAAETVDYGTPGYQNSQFAATASSMGELTIEPAIFSPDNDGFQDLVTISYDFGQQGTVATMRVYDLAGRAIKTLLDNELLGTSGAVSWNGVMDDGSKARIGPYVVLLEAFNLNGDTEVFKKTITLAHRLD